MLSPTTDPAPLCPLPAALSVPEGRLRWLSSAGAPVGVLRGQRAAQVACARPPTLLSGKRGLRKLGVGSGWGAGSCHSSRPRRLPGPAAGRGRGRCAHCFASAAVLGVLCYSQPCLIWTDTHRRTPAVRIHRPCVRTASLFVLQLLCLIPLSLTRASHSMVPLPPLPPLPL